MFYIFYEFLLARRVVNDEGFIETPTVDSSFFNSSFQTPLKTPGRIGMGVVVNENF